jgi:hypothetical protein
MKADRRNIMKARTEKQRRKLLEYMGLSLSPGNTRAFIEVFVYEIENYDSEKAKSTMDKCAKAEGFNAFVLGGALRVIKRNGWYREYGHSSFRDMTEIDLGISLSTAHDYMKVYDALKGEDVPWKKIKHLRWTKLKWYAGHLTDSNVDAWLRAVEGTGDEFYCDFAVPEAMKQEMTEGEMLP